MELKIRRYEEKDSKDVVELDVLALNSVEPGLNQFWPDLQNIREVYLSSGGEFLVGTIGDRVVATVALARISGKEGELKRMRIHPDFQRRGFGKAMLKAIEGRAAELGFTNISLSTAVIQIGACRLYESNGYREYGKREVKAGYLCLSYTKALRPPAGKCLANCVLALLTALVLLLALWCASLNGDPGLGRVP